MTEHTADTWVEGAAGSPYDVDNLPYGVFSHDDEAPRVGVRIGDFVLDVAPVAAGTSPRFPPSRGVPSGKLTCQSSWCPTARKTP